MSYQPIFVLRRYYVDGSGRHIFHFVISQAFYIISDEILISQGNKSTIVCQQCWLKGYTRDIRDLLTKKSTIYQVSSA